MSTRFRADERLTPLGTARRRLAPSASDAWPTALLSELRDADLDETALYLAWEVGRWAKRLSETERRGLVHLVARSLIALGQGSTRLVVSDVERALLAKAPEVVGAPGARTPLVLDGPHLYHQRLFVCEERLATALRARLEQESPFSADARARAVADVFGSTMPLLHAEQEAAVLAAVSRRLTVVSGGPGTGKTTIALAVVRAFVRLGVPPTALALTAPTGKAANRLEESVKAGLGRLAQRSAADEAYLAMGAPAETLHRLLGYSPSRGTFQHHHNNRLAPRLVIVDEGSMVDLFLMERLLRALADDAFLVILGDANQLPSVDAGAVFRDLAPAGVRLAHSHRMDPASGPGRAILRIARHVKDGEAAAIVSGVHERATPAALSFEGVELLPAAGREALFDRWYERLAGAATHEALVAATYRLRDGAFSAGDETKLAALDAHFRATRILCVTRGRPTGANAANAWMHERHGGAIAFAPGEPVMMLRNDYQRRLFNGDQGFVVRVRQEDRPARPMAVFPMPGGPHRFSAFELDGIRDSLELAYATTVHKAQGSEFDEVAVLLPEAPVPLLTRELLYTALTRSRRGVVLCGTADILVAAVARVLTRSSGVAEKLHRRPLANVSHDTLT